MFDENNKMSERSLIFQINIQKAEVSFLLFLFEKLFNYTISPMLFLYVIYV